MTEFAQDCVQTHTVLIYDRGGTKRWRQLRRLTKVVWNRTRSGWPQATITVSGQSCIDQASTINGIQSRRHEAVIFRGEDRVFEGPILQVTTLRGTATIVAADVGEYVKGTALTQDYPFNTGEQVSDSSALMTERVRTIMDYELNTPYQAIVGTGSAQREITIPRWENISPPANVWPYVDIIRSDTLLTRSDTVAFQMTLGDHISNLAQSGLDFVSVGRRLVFWDSATPLGRTRVLTDADFDGELQVIQSGSELYDISHVYAQQQETTDATDVQHVVGTAGNIDDYYGVWTQIKTMSSEDGGTPAQDALNSQAQRNQSGLVPVPLEINVPQNSSLRLGPTLNINQLVPGVVIPVRTTYNIRDVQQDQLLNSMSVTEDASGEKISVQLVALGNAGVVE